MKNLCLIIGFAASSLRAFALGADECQILDRVEEPSWQAHAQYTDTAKVKETDQTLGIFTLRGGGGLGYWATDVGDFELGGLYDASTMNGRGGLNLPDQLLALRLKGSYLWRDANGLSYKTDLEPGYYSDTENAGFSSFYCPVGFSVIKSFAPQFSGLIGVMAYPGMERLLDPRFGIRYAFNDMVYADLMYPESKVVFSPEKDWDVIAGVRAGPPAEYRLTNDERDSVIFSDTRIFAGLNFPVADTIRLMLQTGLAMNRTIEFGNSSAEYDLEDALFVSIGVGGAL